MKVFNDTPSVNQLAKDYVDLTFSIIDNGDDKVCVEVNLGPRKLVNFVCDMYIPEVSLDE